MKKKYFYEFSGNVYLEADDQNEAERLVKAMLLDHYLIEEELHEIDENYVSFDLTKRNEQWGTDIHPFNNEDEFYEFKLKKLVKALEEEKDNLLYNNNLFSNWLGKTGICLSNFLGCLTSDLATIEKVEPFVEDDYEIIQNKHLESISEKRTLNIFNIPEELLEKFNNNQIKKNSIIETLNDIQSNLEKSNISQQRTDLYALTVEISELRAQNPEPEFIDPWL